MGGLSERDVLGHVRDWNAWMARDGGAPCPAFIQALRREAPSVTLLLPVAGLYILLALSRAAAAGLRLHRVAARIVKLRIATDRWWYEPMQCGWNAAHDHLGVACVRLGRIDEAIDCLEKAWRVYPCPHNTSFGLKMNLCRELSPHPQAAESIARYRRLAAAFVACRDSSP